MSFTLDSFDTNGAKSPGERALLQASSLFDAPPRALTESELKLLRWVAEQKPDPAFPEPFAFLSKVPSLVRDDGGVCAEVENALRMLDARGYILVRLFDCTDLEKRSRDGSAITSHGEWFSPSLRDEFGKRWEQLLADAMKGAVCSRNDEANERLGMTVLGKVIALALEAQIKATEMGRTALAIYDVTSTHSPDFTSVSWFGTRYSFTKGNQSQLVRVLWEAWENGGHSLSQETIGEKIGFNGSRFELSKTFRKRKKDDGYERHPAWGTMIQPDSKGSYRLVPPKST